MSSSKREDGMPGCVVVSLKPGRLRQALGRQPSRRGLSFKDNNTNLACRPQATGIEPEKLLPANWRLAAVAAQEGGSGPVRLFQATSMSSMRQVGGSVPVSLLLLRYTVDRLADLPQAADSVPFRRLMLRPRILRPGSSAHSGGRVPDSLLEPARRRNRDFHVRQAGGSWPAAAATAAATAAAAAAAAAG
jgi:hypothetical protein